MIIPGDKADPLTGQEKPITMGCKFLKVKDVGGDATEVGVCVNAAVNLLVRSGNHGGNLADMYQSFQFIGFGQVRR